MPAQPGSSRGQTATSRCGRTARPAVSARGSAQWGTSPATTMAGHSGRAIAKPATPACSGARWRPSAAVAQCLTTSVTGTRQPAQRRLLNNRLHTPQRSSARVSAGLPETPLHNRPSGRSERFHNNSYTGQQVRTDPIPSYTALGRTSAGSSVRFTWLSEVGVFEAQDAISGGRIAPPRRNPPAAGRRGARPDTPPRGRHPSRPPRQGSTTPSTSAVPQPSLLLPRASVLRGSGHRQPDPQQVTADRQLGTDIRLAAPDADLEVPRLDERFAVLAVAAQGIPAQGEA